MILRLNQTDRRIVVDSLSRPLAAVPLALCKRRGYFRFHVALILRGSHPRLLYP